jgi:antigen flippase
VTKSSASPESLATLGPLPHARATTVIKSTYGQILKSSTLIGGSTLVTVVLSIVRAKAMALLLGPAGFGLMGLFSSIADLARSVAQFGISGSGVRQIAAAVASGDEARVARTVTVLRRVTVFLGIFGAAILVLLSREISKLTFGSEAQTAAVALLSLAVLFRLVADGQGALLQGMRRIGDLAKAGVWGAIFGTAVSIALVYFMGQDGVVPSLIAVAAMSIATSMWYSSKIKIVEPKLTAFQFKNETAGLLRLGFSFMASALLMTGASYAVRLIVVNEAGIDAAGLYQAAWTLGGLYVGFVLQAMGTDFYPRLVGAVDDHPECNRLVNEQAQVSLLLAGPGVLGTLALSAIVISVFYTGQFHGAVDTLRWMCLGMMMRVISWPMGFIIVAKGAQTIFLLTEIAWAAVCVGLTWFCVKAIGLNGAGLAFFLACLMHCMLIYPIVRRLTGFRWSASNLRSGLLLLFASAMVFGAFIALPSIWATGFGVVVVALSTFHSIRELSRLLPEQEIPPVFRRLLAFTAKRG